MRENSAHKVPGYPPLNAQMNLIVSQRYYVILTPWKPEMEDRLMLHIAVLYRIF